MIDPKKLRVVHSKKEAKVTDPVRYPEVINEYEGEFKRNYTGHLQSMVNGIGKKMVDYIKE